MPFVRTSARRPTRALDDRFKSYDLVTGEQQIRFYGMMLTNFEGHNRELCVLIANRAR